MTKVLFASAKITYKQLGIYFRNFRFNNNLTQKEFANHLNSNQTYVSKLEHGSAPLYREFYDKLCNRYYISDEDKLMLSNYVVDAKERKINPAKTNLGDHVKKIREKMDYPAYNLSLMISEDPCLIGAIESHNQPFKEDELNKFITTLNLSEIEIDTLSVLNDNFEIQIKPNREFTTKEKLLARIISGGKFKNSLERRKYIYELREQYKGAA